MPETVTRVRVSVRWLNDEGGFVDGATCVVARGPELQAVLDEWSARPRRTEFTIEPLTPNPPTTGLLEQIRARHAAATSGPWDARDTEPTWSLHAGFMQILKAPKRGTPYAEYWPDEADAEFIRRAPEDIGFLLACIDTALERTDFLDGIATGIAENGNPIVAGTLRRAVTAVRNALTGARPRDCDKDTGPSYSDRINAPLRPETISALNEALNRPGFPRYRRARRRRDDATGETLQEGGAQ
jgi:hypothetical protein